MAARKRDHKAEYARRKALAQAKGYKGVREYKRTRRRLSLGRRDPTPPRRKAESLIRRITRAADSEITRLRRESRAWSDRHSHVDRSAYRPSMTDKEVRAYHRAYVEYNPDGLSRRKAARAKRQRIGDYVKQYHGVDDTEWKQLYVGQ